MALATAVMCNLDVSALSDMQQIVPTNLVYILLRFCECTSMEYTLHVRYCCTKDAQKKETTRVLFGHSMARNTEVT